MRLDADVPPDYLHEIVEVLGRAPPHSVTQRSGNGLSPPLGLRGNGESLPSKHESLESFADRRFFGATSGL